MSNLPPTSEIPRARATEGYWAAVHGVEPGDTVCIRDAAGEWHDAIADSRVERGHKFPILWVNAIGKNGQICRLPWPIEAVGPGPRHAD